MFDTPLIAERAASMSFVDFWSYYAAYHSSLRPFRILQWWVAAQAFGARLWPYELVNALSMAIATLAVVRISEILGVSSRRGFLVGSALMVCYAGAYGFLHYPFALNVALGLWGLHWTMRGRRLGVVLITLAALGHEIHLLLSVVALLYSLYERPIVTHAFWWTVALAGVGVVVIVAYLWRRGAVYETSVAEHVVRVVIPALTGGLAVESYRFMGPAYMRVRDFLWTPWALVYVVAAIPTFAAWWTVRSRFLWGWVGVGVVALLLPVGPPESYHLLVVFPALYMLWARLSWHWAPVLVVVILLHVVARVNLAGDVATMRTSVLGRGGWADRAADMTPGYSRELLGVPLLIGGHWAYLPAISSHGSCIREAIWLWDRNKGTMIDSREYAWAVSEGHKLLSHRTMGRVDDGRLVVCR